MEGVLPKISDTNENYPDNFSSLTPYASLEELEGLTNLYPEVVYWKGMKVFALAELQNFRKEEGWYGCRLSERPVLIYGVDGVPLYYEWRVIKDNKEVGTIVVSARKEGETSRYVFGGVKDYSAVKTKGSDAKVVALDYPFSYGVGIGTRGSFSVSDPESGEVIELSNGVDLYQTYKEHPEYFSNVVVVEGNADDSKEAGEYYTALWGSIESNLNKLIELCENMEEDIYSGKDVDKAENYDGGRVIDGYNQLKEEVTNYRYYPYYYSNESKYQSENKKFWWMKVYNDSYLRDEDKYLEGEPHKTWMCGMTSVKFVAEYLGFDPSHNKLAQYVSWDMFGITWPGNLCSMFEDATEGKYTLTGYFYIFDSLGKHFDAIKSDIENNKPIIQLRDGQLDLNNTNKIGWHYRNIVGYKEEKDWKARWGWVWRQIWWIFGWWNYEVVGWDEYIKNKYVGIFDPMGLDTKINLLWVRVSYYGTIYTRGGGWQKEYINERNGNIMFFRYFSK